MFAIIITENFGDIEYSEDFKNYFTFNYLII